MIKPRQKMLLHIYKKAALLNDPTYRNILKECAGVSSAADNRMNQSGFERAMAALETLLFTRVAEHLAPDPINVNKWITQEYYWRKRLPQRGQINSRQAHKIEMLWEQIQPYLPPANRCMDYFGRILHKATGKHDLGWHALTLSEANCMIDALRDRLSYAIRGHEKGDISHGFGTEESRAVQDCA